MKQSFEPELMDSPDVDGPVLEKFHRDLARIHRLLGSFPTIERFLRSDDLPVTKVLDIGCGGGALLEYLQRRTGLEVVGVDQKPGVQRGIEIIAANAVTDPLPQADVAISSLVAHHLTREENIALIRNVSKSCRRFIILDLIRHPLPLVFFTIFICRVIGREAAVDGRQSIRRAFTTDEFADMVRTAIKGTGATFTIDVPTFLSRQIIDIRFPRPQS